jgi:parallel beta-helix repeat protein
MLFMRRLLLSLIIFSLLIPIPAALGDTAAWEYTAGQMIYESFTPYLFALPDGSALMWGGDNFTGQGATGWTYMFDPATGTWYWNGQSVEYWRQNGPAIGLSDGRVLLIGEANFVDAQYSGRWNYSEVWQGWYWARTGITNYYHCSSGIMSLLSNGKVLVLDTTVGGPHNLTYWPNAEIYDPATNNWKITQPPSAMPLNAVTLANGKVLAIGGWRSTGDGGEWEYVNACQLYDPASETWTPTGHESRLRNRNKYNSILLPNGKVLVVGGIYVEEGSDSYTAQDKCELYDPATGSWTATGSLHVPREEGFSLTLLHNGKVLVAGGLYWDTSTNPYTVNFTNSCELYDFVTGAWEMAASLNTTREPVNAVLLKNGQVLAVGGYGNDFSNGPYGDLKSCELYGLPEGGLTFEVTTTADTGDGSMRQAITNSNNNPGHNTITFNISNGQGTGAPGGYHWDIPLSSPLPPITNPVTISGSTQPTDEAHNNPNGPVIEISGTGIPSACAVDMRGIVISAPDCVVEGLVINRFSRGIDITGARATGCQVYNNYIGTDITGSTIAGYENCFDGILIEQGASGNVIGRAGAGNVLSGNRFGLTISAANHNQIIGNYIGTDRTGTVRLGNTYDGIQLRLGASNNQIGDGTAGGRNIISGNGARGIVANETSAGNTIIGNYIGTDATGANALGNADAGVWIQDAVSTARIGGTTAGERNVISGNTGPGIALNSSNNVVQGNYIGCDGTGSTKLANGWDGIDLTDGGHNQIGGSSAGAGNVISGNDNGIYLYNSASNTILGNKIGCAASGSLMVHGGNSTNGIIIDNSNNNQVGDGTPGGRNIISGNTYVGIFVANGSTGNSLGGNYIGCGSDGASALPNATGVELSSSPANTVGAGNVISGNSSEGLWITGSSYNSILGNYIGCDATGTVPLPNGTVYTDPGIRIDWGSSHTLIGDGSAQGSNLIFGNNGDGVYIDSFMSDTIYNTISRNSFHDNFGLGITLANAGNQWMPAPTITTATLTNAIGTSRPNATIEVFATGTPEYSGAGEGRTYLGSATADSNGYWNAALALTGLTTLTATATDTNGNTSQFSQNKVAGVLGFVVTNTYDTGEGSLRQCLTSANAAPDRATITFDIPLSDPGYVTESGVSFWRISPSSELPIISNSVAVLGSTQTANRGNTNLLGPEIELSGYGLTITGVDTHTLANNCTIEGLAINNSYYYYGISLGFLENGSYLISGCNIHDNYLGTDPSGTVAEPNWGGVVVYSGANNRITNNLLSGNNFGVSLVEASGNVIAGNHVGTDPSGTTPVPNWVGINLDVGEGNQIANNFVSGNYTAGILLEVGSGGDNNNVITGNHVGTDPSGTTPVPNGYGIHIDGGMGNRVGPGNVIADNLLDGVKVESFLATSNNNTITQNSIFGNQGLGIELMSGANGGISAPTIEAATVASASGSTVPNATVEVFATGAPDPSGSGEGRTYLASTLAGPDGHWALSLSVTEGTTLTATATDRNGNTSMFSLNYAGSTFEVTNTNDDGPNSLRQIITYANALPNLNKVVFSIPTSDPGYVTENGASFWRIKPLLPLPYLTRSGIVIDGTTQAARWGNKNPNGPEINIDGSASEADEAGLNIFACSNCVVKGLALNNFKSGEIMLSGASYTTIEGCYLGITPDGAVATSKAYGSVGIRMIHSSNNTVGGWTAAGRNVISGHTNGIGLLLDSASSSNNVIGNYIGTDKDGQNAVGNGVLGIEVTGGSRDNYIGNYVGPGFTSSAAGRNVISGNSGGGIDIESDYNHVLNNYIGPDVTGGNALGNFWGVVIFSGANNQIGDGSLGGRNVISGNPIGVSIGGPSENNIIKGNNIGTDPSGYTAVPNLASGIDLNLTSYNTIEGNIISGNGDSGIVLDNCSYDQIRLNDIGCASDRMTALPNNTGILFRQGTSSEVVYGNVISGNNTGIQMWSASNNWITQNGIGNGLYDVRLPNTSYGIDIADQSTGNVIGPGNTIANNGADGLSISGADALSNTITQNSIHDNSGLGIFLAAGANNALAAPTIETAGVNTIAGFAPANATVEVFATGAPDPSGSGEGRTYLGSTIALSDGSWSLTLGSPLTGDTTLSATATDQQGSTSMFGWNFLASPFLIKLSITREADTVGRDVIVSWATSDVPDVYMLTGDGSGMYTNDPSTWTQVTNPVASGFNLFGNTLHHQQQVGMGIGEAYYKAIKAGLAKADFLPSAEAVGKVNILVQTYPPTMELIALPVVPDNSDINAVIGAQFGTGLAEVWSRFNAPINGWGSQKYNGSYWYGSLPAGQTTKDRGYWIKSLTADKMLTFVGRIAKADESYSFNNETLFFYGNSYPRAVPWAASGLSTVFGPGDQIWQWDNGWQSKRYQNSNSWGGSTLPGLLFRHGFWVSKHSASGTWNFPKPY